MSAQDDFNKALTDLSAVVSKVQTDVAAVVAALKGSTNSDATLESAATTLEGVVAQLGGVATSLEAAVAPPATT